ncbi:hypothetical protein V5799_016884 [Amblyomma americanum]|uniref:Barrier-to-autointegration factor-like protein n=1 Tax=Amblyomma americanum TaxID=6943 RepID=A0AAQ4F3U1_AMBAM
MRAADRPGQLCIQKRFESLIHPKVAQPGTIGERHCVWWPLNFAERTPQSLSAFGTRQQIQPFTDLAGIGEVLGKRLEQKGFDKAYVVLGQFLVLKKNKDIFVDWMKDICGANNKQATDCYQCLYDWCDEFL